MKVEFNAILKQIGATEVTKHGFRQDNIFTIPELKDEFENVKRKEQFFVVQVYSTKQTDSRFLTSVDVGDKFDFAYNLQLNLFELKEPIK